MRPRSIAGTHRAIDCKVKAATNSHSIMRQLVTHYAVLESCSHFSSLLIIRLSLSNGNHKDNCKNNCKNNCRDEYKDDRKHLFAVTIYRCFPAVRLSNTSINLIREHTTSF